MDISPVSRMTPAIATEAADRPRMNPDVASSVITAVRALNKSELLGEDRQLLFARDRDTGTTVIQIIERSSGRVMDQIPPEQVLRILAGLGEDAGSGVEL